MAAAHRTDAVPALPADGFPDAESLCERCGYRLHTLPPEANCPECGTPVQASHPRHREGLPWQHRQGLSSWLATMREVTFRPRCAFRRMSIHEATRKTLAYRDFGFLLIVCVLAGGLFGLVELVSGNQHLFAACASVAQIGFAVLALTAFEALGVAYFYGGAAGAYQFAWRFNAAATHRSPGCSAS